MLVRPVLLGVAALAAGIEAQEASASGSTPTSTSTSAATTHSISVGANGFKFEPNVIENASVGDIIEWRFYPSGHSVVRAGFKNPCIPYEDTGPNRVGFFSGFETVNVVSNDPPTFQVRVNDTVEPIFFYCSAPGSCVDQHMIGVINPNATWTFDIQEQFVLNTTYQLNPGEPFPSETASASASATPSSTGSSSSHHSGGTHLSAGAIAGIAIGAAAAVVLGGVLIYLCGRRGGLDKAYHHNRNSFPTPMVEAKFAPKSPGQETFSTTHYSMAPGTDPYHQGAPTPPIQSHFTGSTGSPPPMTPGSHSGSAYAPFPSPGYQVPSPMMGMEGSTMDSHGYYGTQPSPPPQPYQQPPIELPTSSDPGNSPLPGYPGRHFSWAQGTESGYRPSGKH